MKNSLGEKVRARSDAFGARVDRRNFKIPGLSKLRIGGSIGQAAEKIKGSKYGSAALSGGNLGSFLMHENARAGGDIGKTADYLKGDVLEGARNYAGLKGASELAGHPISGGMTVTGGGVPGGPVQAGGPIGGDVGGTDMPGLNPFGGEGGDSGIQYPGSQYPGGGGPGVPGSAADPSMWGRVMDFLGDHGAQILAGAQGVNSAILGQKAREYGKNALGQAEQSYNEREPLRAAGIAGMLNPQTPDLSGLMKNAGPYAAGLPAVKPLASYASYQQTPGNFIPATTKDAIARGGG